MGLPAQGGSAGKCWLWDPSPGRLALQPWPPRKKKREGLRRSQGERTHLAKSGDTLGGTDVGMPAGGKETCEGLQPSERCSAEVVASDDDLSGEKLKRVAAGEFLNHQSLSKAQHLSLFLENPFW